MNNIDNCFANQFIIFGYLLSHILKCEQPNLHVQELNFNDAFLALREGQEKLKRDFDFVLKSCYSSSRCFY